MCTNVKENDRGFGNAAGSAVREPRNTYLSHKMILGLFCNMAAHVYHFVCLYVRLFFCFCLFAGSYFAGFLSKLHCSRYVTIGRADVSARLIVTCNLIVRS